MKREVFSPRLYFPRWLGVHSRKTQLAHDLRAYWQRRSGQVYVGSALEDTERRTALSLVL